MLMDRFLRMTSGPGPSNSSTSSTSAAVSHNHNHNNNQSAVPSHVNLAFSDPRTYCYNSFLGMPLARDAAAYFLARRFLFQQEITATVALQHIQPQHIAWATGAAALLHHLFVLLGNPDAEEACLIPQPYYAAFDNHMQLVGRVTPCGIPQTNPLMGPSTDDLDRAHRTASEVCRCIRLERKGKVSTVSVSMNAVAQPMFLNICSLICIFVARLDPSLPLDHQSQQSPRRHLQSKHHTATCGLGAAPSDAHYR